MPVYIQLFCLFASDHIQIGDFVRQLHYFNVCFD